jgi:hypothetical protein
VIEKTDESGKQSQKKKKKKKKAESKVVGANASNDHIVTDAVECADEEGIVCVCNSLSPLMT